jgi:hypothetical protein
LTLDNQDAPAFVRASLARLEAHTSGRAAMRAGRG